jgi:pimeloyl-ACP methyl ester carboxylesterase
MLDEVDTAALALLPDRAAAAERFASGFEPFRAGLQGPDATTLQAFRARHSRRDNEILDRPGVSTMQVTALRASMASGTSGGGWDNVAWVGPWDIDLADVRRPVDLWYGGDDHHHPPGAAQWLVDHLPYATLHLAPGDGHLGVIEHLDEILRTLTAD